MVWNVFGKILLLSPKRTYNITNKVRNRTESAIINRFTNAAVVAFIIYVNYKQIFKKI